MRRPNCAGSSEAEQECVSPVKGRGPEECRHGCRHGRPEARSTGIVAAGEETAGL